MHPDRAFPCCSCIVVPKAAQSPADVLWTLPEYTPVNASVFVSESLTFRSPAAGLAVCLSEGFPPLPSTAGAGRLFGDDVAVGETAESSAQQQDLSVPIPQLTPGMHRVSVGEAVVDD